MQALHTQYLYYEIKNLSNEELSHVIVTIPIENEGDRALWYIAKMILEKLTQDKIDEIEDSQFLRIVRFATYKE